MPKKNLVFTSVWSAIICALFYALYGLLPTGGNVSFSMCWVMFIMLICFFAMRLNASNFMSMALSSLIGCFWGQICVLVTIQFVPFVGVLLAGTFSVGIVTVIMLILHGGVLSKTPFGLIPFNFAGVALTFSQFQGNPGDNVIALFVTMLLGIVMACLCGLGYTIAEKIFAKQEVVETTLNH
ncbi:DUF1097 domain-containing protein [Eubacteriaceae bacterium ES2]|nr:DUF1097 domain-containing protein [Eubacteriaceae bacterium ES2]